MANFPIDIDINNDMIYQSLLENDMTTDDRMKVVQTQNYLLNVQRLFSTIRLC